MACASHRGPSLRGADSRVSLGVDEGGFVEVDGRWLIGSKKPFVPPYPQSGHFYLGRRDFAAESPE